MNKLSFAKQLRHNQTETEKVVWFHLRSRKLNGIKFKRQEIIGKYIADFVSYEKMLIIELDGGQHSDIKNKVMDEKRTKYLESLGFHVLRFWDNEIHNNIEGVLEEIISKASPSPWPSPQGEGIE